jgi:spore coat polysaccharide biosynthesis protein SpsF
LTCPATAVIVLQARMGSQRCPGKVLARVGRWPLAEYCVRRLASADVGPVVVATTTAPEDEPVLALASDLGEPGWAGPANDVLARFAQVAEQYPAARYILRATADNPFVDADGCARILKVLSDGADYAVEEALPLGAAVEGVRREVLLRAQREAVTAYDREHVTPWVKRADDVVRVIPLAPAAVRAPDLRLTVDTPDDLAFARRLAARLERTGLDPRLAPLLDVIAAARGVARQEVA